MKKLSTQCRQLWGRRDLQSLRRIAVAVVGGCLLLVGIALIVLPGPAFIVIPLGLGILASEFVWAKRWLKKIRSKLPQRRKLSATRNR